MAVQTRLVAILAVMAIVVAFGAASVLLDLSSLQGSAPVYESRDTVAAVAPGMVRDCGLARFRTTDIAPQ